MVMDAVALVILSNITLVATFRVI